MQSEQLSMTTRFDPNQPLWKIKTKFEGSKAMAFDACLHWEFAITRQGLHPWPARILGHLINLTTREGGLEGLVTNYKGHEKKLMRVANGLRQAIMAFIELKQQFRDSCASCSSYQDQEEDCNFERLNADKNELVQALDASNCTHVQSRFLSLMRDSGRCQLTQMPETNYHDYMSAAANPSIRYRARAPIVLPTAILPPYNDTSNFHLAIDVLHWISPDAFDIDDLRGNSVYNPQNTLTLRDEHGIAFDLLREWLYIPQGENAHYIVESVESREIFSQILLAPSHKYFTSTISAVSPHYLTFHAMLARAYHASGIGSIFSFKELESTEDMEWLAATIKNEGFKRAF